MCNSIDDDVDISPMKCIDEYDNNNLIYWSTLLPLMEKFTLTVAVVQEPKWLSRGSNPQPFKYWADTLPTTLTRLHLWTFLAMNSWYVWLADSYWVACDSLTGVGAAVLQVRCGPGAVGSRALLRATLACVRQEGQTHLCVCMCVCMCVCVWSVGSRTLIRTTLCTTGRSDTFVCVCACVYVCVCGVWAHEHSYERLWPVYDRKVRHSFCVVRTKKKFQSKLVEW
jgi:hypothetical protein